MDIKKYIDDSFFIIDSRKLNDVKDFFCGFSYDDNDDFVTRETIDLSCFVPRGEGVYSYVKVTDDTIIIKQDSCSSFGIYVFDNNEIFVISNSFLKLLDYVKEESELSLNRGCADFFLIAPLSSRGYTQTLVKEIKSIPRNGYVEIDFLTKTWRECSEHYYTHTIDIDSAYAMKILDRWYNRWTKFVRDRMRDGENIEVDISGGFDSRILFAILAGAKIDLNSLYFHSIDDDLHTHREDWIISNQIAQKYDFKLNDRSNIHTDRIPFTADESLYLSLMSKLCFHKELFFKTAFHKKRLLHFTGGSGEGIRDYKYASISDFIEHEAKSARMISDKEIRVEYGQAVQDVTLAEMEELKQRLDERNPETRDLINQYIFDVRSCSHFGKWCMETYFSNSYMILPAQDVRLKQIKLSSKDCSDANLLLAVIMVRYAEDLLAIPYDGNRTISQNTLEMAKELSNKYPKAINSYEDVITLNHEADLTPETMNEGTNCVIEAQRIVEGAFYSSKVRKLFAAEFTENVYRDIAQDYRKRKYHPLKMPYAVLSIAKVLEAVNYSQIHCRQDDCLEWMKNSLVQRSDYDLEDDFRLEKYDEIMSARIDIKNYGCDSCDITFDEIQTDISIFSPEWYSQNGKGYVIESRAGEITLKFTCVADGELQLNFRGIFKKDAEGNRIPVYAVYRSVLLDDLPIISDATLSWHDKPIKYRIAVKDGDHKILKVRWGNR